MDTEQMERQRKKMLRSLWLAVFAAACGAGAMVVSFNPWSVLAGTLTISNAVLQNAIYLNTQTKLEVQYMLANRQRENTQD